MAVETFEWLAILFKSAPFKRSLCCRETIRGPPPHLTGHTGVDRAEESDFRGCVSRRERRDMRVPETKVDVPKEKQQSGVRYHSERHELVLKAAAQTPWMTHGKKVSQM